MRRTALRFSLRKHGFSVRRPRVWPTKAISSMFRPSENDRKRGTRRVLSTKDETRAAVVEIVARANRGLAILTPDLEPDIYDHDEFLETVKRFLLQRTFARVRVLISNPQRTFKQGNRFVDVGRRLNSYIEFRNLKAEYQDHAEAFCIADETAVVYRARADSWEGMADTYEPGVARKYLAVFEQLWQASRPDAEPRRQRG